MSRKTLELNEELFSKLVPDTGKCETLEGEMIRASNKICYEMDNNGFGNDVSGAWNFLFKFKDLLNISEELSIIDDNCAGVMMETHNEQVVNAVYSICEKVVNYVDSRTEYTNNDIDMFDCNEPLKPIDDDYDSDYDLD